MRDELEQKILNGLYHHQTKKIVEKFNPNHDEKGRFSSGGGSRQKQTFASLNDAGDWATANVTKDFSAVGGHGEKVGIAITEQISEISPQFPLAKKLTGIHVFPQKPPWSDGSYSPYEHDIWINDRLRTDKIGIGTGVETPSLEDGIKSKKCFNVGQLCDNYAKATITHEYGHAVMNDNIPKIQKMFGSIGTGRNIITTEDRKVNQELAKKYAVSRYSEKSFDECLAENFSAYYHGAKSAMHPDMVKLFDSIAKG